MYLRQTMILLMFAAVAGCASTSSPPTIESMSIVPFEAAKFVPVSARLPDGPQLAVLWGDPAQGPSAMLMKIKKGPGPLHTHTSDYHLVILQGVMKHWGAGETEDQAKPLGPGSYWFQPGKQVHGDSCLTDECLFHVVWSGKRDGQLAVIAKP